jgi:hypothetical protein
MKDLGKEEAVTEFRKLTATRDKETEALIESLKS